jgi:hypothetical protein
MSYLKDFQLTLPLNRKQHSFKVFGNNPPHKPFRLRVQPPI